LADPLRKGDLLLGDGRVVHHSKNDGEFRSGSFPTDVTTRTNLKPWQPGQAGNAAPPSSLQLARRDSLGQISDTPVSLSRFAAVKVFQSYISISIISKTLMTRVAI
jgi:hypothetical protein